MFRYAAADDAERNRMPIKNRLLPIILAALICFTLLAAPVAASSASTAQEISNAQATRDSYNQRLYQARSNQQALTGQTNQLSADLAWIATRSDEQRALCELVLQQKNDALMIMAQTAADYADAVQRLEDKKEQYASRLRIMFDYTGQSMLDIFLEADTLQSFFTTVEFMKLISEADEQMIVELTAAREDADRRKADAAEAAAEMERVVQEADATLAEIQQNELMSNSRMYDLKIELTSANNEAAVWAAETARVDQEIAFLTSQYNAQIQAEYEAEQARIAEQNRLAEIARQEALAAQRAAQQTPVQTPAAPPVYSGGGFAWPVPGYYAIVSYYGWRSFGGGEFHAGVDVPAPMGAPIVAAKAGIVIMAHWYGGFGNFVAVAHGNGIVTFYAHMSGFAVSAGQSVAAGQTIGYIGSTGRSTGPHLHFEVRTGTDTGFGTAVNPMNFF